MDGGRTRYEILVATSLNAASLATLRIGATPTVVPRRTVYRLRVPAARGLPEVLNRLTDHDVEVLEIRRCVQGRHELGRAGDETPVQPVATGDTVDGESSVVPFPLGRIDGPPASRRDRTGRRPAPDDTAPDAARAATPDAPARRTRGHLRIVPC
jgi:hypothetical protein